MMKSKVLFIVWALLVGCSSKDPYQKFFDVTPVSDQSITINSLTLDSIRLKTTGQLFTGFLQVHDDTLYFLNDRFNMFLFAADGTFLEKHLGAGRGPGELPQRAGGYYYDPVQRKHYLFNSFAEGYSFDQTWTNTSHISVSWRGPDADKVSLNNILPQEPSIYDFVYAPGDEWFLFHGSGKYLYVPILLEAEKFSPYNTASYYTDARILARLDLSTNKVVDVLGRWSPVYQKYHYLGHHAVISFDIDSQENFLIGFQIDPLIYKYDSNFHIQQAFGVAGKEMDQSYIEYNGVEIDKIDELMDQELEARGYYDRLTNIESKNLLFRSYKKGSHVKYDGLQIYRDRVLIGDVRVPKGFYVTGYIDPWFYSGADIADDGSVKVYRFKLAE